MRYLKYILKPEESKLPGIGFWDRVIKSNHAIRWTQKLNMKSFVQIRKRHIKN